MENIVVKKNTYDLKSGDYRILTNSEVRKLYGYKKAKKKTNK